MIPYIGVTGFMSRDEINHALWAFPPDCGRKLMIGVLGSQKTLLQGGTNRWPNRYPKPEQIAGIFPDDLRALNLIHYSTKEPDSLLEQMLAVTEMGGPKMHGFQLNIKWPQIPHLCGYREQHPDKVIVLQIGERAFHDERGLMGPQALADKIADYCDVVDYVLLDRSGGFGTALDPEGSLQYLDAIYGYDDGRLVEHIKVGVAGGLSAESMSLMQPLAAHYPDLSIDAEGRLRTADDRLDPGAARAYLESALMLFKS